MKRSSSLNDSDEASLQNQTSEVATSEITNDIHQTHLSLTTSDDGRPSSRWTQDVFRKWASKSIDRSGINATAEVIPSSTQPTRDVSMKSAGRTVSMSNDNGNNESDPSFDYFLSDPSMSEEEAELGSSHADYRKKMIYRQRLSAAGRNTHPVPRSPEEWDAMSAEAGNTSLSSSNISPSLPRFKIQFDASSASERSLNNIQEKGDDIIPTKQSGSHLFGEVRKKIKAAVESASAQSPRLPFSRLHSETSDITDKSPFDGGFFESALLPPSSAVASPQTGKSSDAGGGGGGGRRMQSKLPYARADAAPDEIPQLPFLDNQHVREQEQTGMISLSSFDDSILGTKLVSEQSGGESSSSIMVLTNESSDQSFCRPITVSTSKSSDSPSKKTARKKRLRFSKYNQPPVHRRTRSGDHVAANLMNSGREDWIGMNLDNLPLPGVGGVYDDEDDSTLPMKKDEDVPRNPSKQTTSLFAYGSTNNPHEVSDMTGWGEGFSVGSSGSPVSPSSHVERRRNLDHRSNSDEAFHSADSSGLSSVVHQHAHASSFDQNIHKVWDGVNTVRYVPDITNAPILPQPRQHHHISWNLQRGGSFKGSIGSSDIMYNTLIPESPRGDNESDYSTGSSASASSPSYVDDDDKSFNSKRRSLEFQKLKLESPSVQSRDTKFDKIMERVTNVLDKPLYRERTKQNTVTDDTKYPTFICPNCRTEQRAFIDVTTAAGSFESPLGYVAVYLALYLVSSLFVFGLEEGWVRLRDGV